MKRIIHNPRVREESLLIPVSSLLGNFAHLLRRTDIYNVKAVADYLTQHSMEVYLSGGVIKEALTTGDKNYTDVDLLATGTESARLKVTQDLYGHLRPGKVFRVHEQEFDVGHVGAKHNYLNGKIDERFTLTPRLRVEEGRRAPAGIDLSLVSQENLRKSLQ